MTNNASLSATAASTPSMRRQVLLVARREIIERVRQRAFVIATLVFLAIIVAIAVLPKVLDSPTEWNIGTVDKRSKGIAELAKSIIIRSEEDAKITIKSIASEAEGKQLVRDGKISALLIANGDSDPTVFVNRRLGDAKRAVLDAAIQRDRVIQRADRLGIPQDKALELAAPGAFAITALDPPDEKREGDTNLARAAAVILFFQVIQFGNMLALGVVEEKQSRVLEVLLGRTRARTLLTGKLLGIGAVGLGQTLLYTAVGLTAASASGLLELSGASFAVTAMILFWFVLGFALFSALFVIAGALAGRQEDLQNTAGLPMVISMGSYFATTALMGSPESTGATIASYIPSVAPLLMPVRFASGDAPAWQVLIAIIVTVVFIALALRFSAAIYLRTVLMNTRQTLFSLFRKRKAGASLR
jgi:ABC-2 type transport system permease protein